MRDISPTGKTDKSLIWRDRRKPKQISKYRRKGLELVPSPPTALWGNETLGGEGKGEEKYL